jgi:nicotinamidase-related amidase
MNSALIVVDIQNDYFPGGAMELVGSYEAATVAASIKSEFKAKNFPVIMVQHIAMSPTATFFLPGTEGAEIHESVKLVDGDYLVVKHFPNSFRETNLLEILRDRNITDLTIVGMMTHMCIDTTVRAANDLGFKVTVYENACATRDLSYERTVAAVDVQAAYLAALDGSFAEVKTWN